MLRTVRLFAAVLFVCAVGGAAGAEDAQVSLISAAASSEAGESHAVSRLFDLDEASTWCAREKARVSVALKLSAARELTTLDLALGDYSDWRGGPRVKQVYVSVLMGDALVKKVRHKWPDSPEPREGRVNLNAPGDRVLVEIDLVYAGQGTGGLCLSGMRLEGVDLAPLAAAAWGAENVEKSLIGKHAIDDGWLVLEKRGKFEWSSGDLKVSGKWKVVDGALELSVTRARHLKTKLADAVLRGELRFGPRNEGDAPSFTPHFGIGMADGALVVTRPLKVAAP